MLSRCPYNSQVVCTIVELGKMTHTNSVLNCDKMDISIPCSTTQVRAHHSANHTEVSSIPSKLIFQKFHIFPFPHTHTFSFYKTNCIVFKVLSVLAAINVQTHSNINLGGQGMVITNQGVAIQPCFSSRQNICNFIKQANGLCL